MRSSKSIYRFTGLVAVLLGLLLGCARPPSGITEQPPEEQVPTGDTRGFDPLELPADREIIPAKYPRAGTISGRQVLVEAEPEKSKTDTSLAGLENFTRQVDTLNNQAFRVQLFTSKLYQEARETARVAEEIFDQPVYVEYQVPNFKVRVGDFASREDAESYAQRSKAVGYSSAWVVMVNVEVKEAAPLYDNTSGYFLEEPTLPRDSLEQPRTDD